MSINKDPKPGPGDIALVRRAQRSLALAGRHRNLVQYLERDSFQNVAAMLTKHYMPRSCARQLILADVFQELYAHWLVLAPISNQIQGYWRPWWSPATVVDWLRASSLVLGRTYLGRLKLDWENASIESGAAATRIKDPTFLSGVDTLLAHAYGSTLRAKFARYVLSPLVWRTVGEQALDIARANNSSLLWYEDEVLWLADRPHDAMNATWCDLRTEKAEVLEWRVQMAKGHLHITTRPKALQQLRQRITQVLESGTSPQQKLREVNAATRTYHHWARYAFGTQQQAWEQERWIWRKLSRHIFEHHTGLRDGYFNLRNAPWNGEFLFARPSMLLGAGVSNEAWWSIWNPRR